MPDPETTQPNLADRTWMRSLCPTCGRLPREGAGRHLVKDSTTMREARFTCERDHTWWVTWPVMKDGA